MGRRILLVLWFGACFAVLAFAIAQREYRDTDIAFTYLMFFLTFPGGLLVALVFAGASSSILIPGGIWFVAIAWPLFLIVGYTQWFVVVPKLYRWLLELRHARP